MTDDDNNIVNLDKIKNDRWNREYIEGNEKWQELREELLEVVRKYNLSSEDSIEALAAALGICGGDFKFRALDLVKTLCCEIDVMVGAGGVGAWSNEFVEWYMEGMPTEWCDHDAFRGEKYDGEVNEPPSTGDDDEK
jgi:hypothetical protein